jgi:ABC-type multidrug transport system ATPase subunit
MLWANIRFGECFENSVEEGTTIILATNELYEADVLSDRVGIMHRGKLLVCDTPQRLKDSIVGGDIVEIQFEAEPSPKIVEAAQPVQGSCQNH